MLRQWGLSQSGRRGEGLRGRERVFVMLGSMLAGHDECEAEWIEEDGKRIMKFYGMSSQTALTGPPEAKKITAPVKAGRSSFRTGDR